MSGEYVLFDGARVTLADMAVELATERVGVSEEESSDAERMRD